MLADYEKVITVGLHLANEKVGVKAISSSAEVTDCSGLPQANWLIVSP